jgi:hypothetical protein
MQTRTRTLITCDDRVFRIVILRKWPRIRFPHSTNICVHEHVCWYTVWVFLHILYMYKKVHIIIRHLESLTQALRVLN